MSNLTTLDILGYLSLGLIVFSLIKRLLSGIYTYAIGPVVNQVDFVSMGKWALITGSTDGIGKEYARQLASRGCNIVLVSRSIDKLKATAEELEKEFKVSTKIIQVDFSGEENIYEHIEKSITDLEIGTLVNNVGVSYSYPEYFLDLPEWEKITSTLIKANVVSMVKMSHIVLPAMVKRGKGVVINIGSASSIIPSPLLTVYAATKAFVEKFSEGLSMEYGKQGIIVQCVLPGFVCSNMSGIRRSSLIAPTAKDFVKSAIGLVGTVTKTTGYFPHTVFVSVINFIYNTLPSFGVWLVTRSMENSRRKTMKKYNKTK